MRDERGFLSEEDRSRLRGELLRQRTLLLEDRSALEEGACRAGDAGLTNHPAGLATDAIDAQVSVALLEGEAERLREIDEALDRIHRGVYGRCGECGGPIGGDRLEAIPHARLCRPCKERAEASL